MDYGTTTRVVDEREESVNKTPTVHTFAKHDGIKNKVQGGTTFGALDIEFTDEKEREDIIEKANLSPQELELYKALSKIDTTGLDQSSVNALNEGLRTDENDKLARKIRKGLISRTALMLHSRKGKSYTDSKGKKHTNPQTNPVLDTLSDEQTGALIALGIKNKEVNYAIYDKTNTDFNSFRKNLKKAEARQSGDRNKAHYKYYIDKYFPEKKVKTIKELFEGIK